MNKVVVFGVTGYAGANITKELLERGNQVIGVARHPENVTPQPNLTAVSGNIHDPKFVDEITAGADVIVVALHAKPAEGPLLIDAIPAVLQAAKKNGARLGVVGGAGSLLVSEDGPRVIDGDFPAEFLPEATAHAVILDALQESDTTVDWFYLSPAGGFGSYNPGVKTGKFRLGEDVLVVDAAGNSNISGADYAVAFVDEIEKPAHHQSRFTLGY